VVGTLTVVGDSDESCSVCVGAVWEPAMHDVIHTSHSTDLLRCSHDLLRCSHAAFLLLSVTFLVTAVAAQPTCLDSLAVSSATTGRAAAAGAVLVPVIPGSPALGAATGTGLTRIAPADVYLPQQHEALFR
jgi:hypothetical protein